MQYVDLLPTLGSFMKRKRDEDSELGERCPQQNAGCCACRLQSRYSAWPAFRYVLCLMSAHARASRPQQAKMFLSTTCRAEVWQVEAQEGGRPAGQQDYVSASPAAAAGRRCRSDLSVCGTHPIACCAQHHHIAS